MQQYIVARTMTIVMKKVQLIHCKEWDHGQLQTILRFDQQRRLRMLHTSHSVLKNKPSIRRPMTTTALERRKPPPSTIASQRSKAQEFSKRLLGPITLEPKRPNCDFVVPNSLFQNEWENELARNVINVFTNKAREEIKREREEEEQEQGADIDTLIGALSTTSSRRQMIENRDSLFSDCSTFQAHEFMNDGGSDFQSIPISRDACNDVDSNNTNSEFLAEEIPKQEHQCLRRTKKDDGLQNGTFRLKMIWFTGTGDVGADWTVLNGEYLLHVVVVDCNSLLYYFYNHISLTPQLHFHQMQR